MEIRVRSTSAGFYSACFHRSLIQNKLKKEHTKSLQLKLFQMKFRYEGHSPDNNMMESFFGILKSEMFYGYENTFKSLNQLEQANVDYIDYYNNK